MHIVVNRPPNDSFSFRLFTKLVNTAGRNNVDSMYVWPSMIQPGYLNGIRLDHNIFILAVRDMLSSNLCPLDNSLPYGTPGFDLIKNFARSNRSKKIILLTSLENLDKEAEGESNLIVISAGGDITNQELYHSKVPPVLEKNLQSNIPFISLSRNSRYHRRIATSYLLEKGLHQTGWLSYLSQPVEKAKYNNFLDSCPWEFRPYQEANKLKICNGFLKLLDADYLQRDDLDIYNNCNNDNILNFNLRLRPLYKNSFVELVAETTFSEPSFMLTEKTLNSILGCNFPIILNGMGAVAHMREIGFDMFDDIIDHSYDTIENPIDRILSAIDLNTRMITDISFVKDAWNLSTNRFEKNIEVSRSLYSWYERRAAIQFEKLIDDNSF